MRDLARQVRDECDRMDASDFADVCVDTTGVSAGEAAVPSGTAAAAGPGSARPAGYIDLNQIGFLAHHPAGDPLNHRLKAVISRASGGPTTPPEPGTW